MSDLRHVSFGKLQDFGITAHLDKQRVMDVIRSDDAEVMALFKYQTASQVRTIVSQFLPVGDIKMQRNVDFDIAGEHAQVMEICGEEQLTGYQIRDIFDENLDLVVIKRKLGEKVKQNKMFNEGLIREQRFGRNIKKDEKKELPPDNIEGIFKSLGLADCIPKLKEQDIYEPDLFYQVSSDKLIELLDVKTEGKKHLLTEKLKSINDRHEKRLQKKAALEVPPC